MNDLVEKVAKALRPYFSGADDAYGIQVECARAVLAAIEGRSPSTHGRDGMSETKFTPGPWVVGDFDDHGGYDCMTSGIYAGDALLDGRRYGQKACTPIDEGAKARIIADARLIAAAPELYDALEALVSDFGDASGPLIDAACAVLSKARGKTP